ncbi:MAG: TSUP family transporter [Lachnospiraceae bacterium]|nr:TSUP family transporter [Lachnospiraceae bacterium]
MLEYFWCFIAAALAGIGTGLAGLSAATVMVPVLIVLCPSFAGETGAYQATAIALASDILGSAVTTATYIRHKNIDLKRGWIMLVCILSMCTVGSFAAWKAGNVVLGGFTLFLTFCIGIRFLLKPSTERKETVSKGAKLNAKGVAVSLFFGLTIGFGTGFVGSGGGMMMLVVFTAFLGMGLKPAVGTSTFIMTFTALIASVSHILIHPAIVLERWNILLLCMVVATVFSLVSARFANQVDNRTVGLVTGVVLTLLGGTMIVLHYWETIHTWSILSEVLVCFGKYLLFIIPAALFLILLHVVLKIEREVFRKLLHIAAFSSTAVIVYHAQRWQAACLTLVLFAVIVYPLLHLAERWRGYDNLFVQRRTGEVKKSLLILFLTDAVLVAIAWGIFDLPFVAVTAIFMWGCGDGVAALVGKRYGKHHVKLKWADEKKTWEGSCGMLLVSAVVGVICMLLMTALPWYQCLLMVLPAAVFGTYTELITKNGNDTATVPAVNTAVLLVLTVLSGV